MKYTCEQLAGGMGYQPMHLRSSAFICGFIALFASMAQAAPFDVYPADVNLETSRDRQSIVVRVVDPNGVNRDITSQVQVTITPPTLAKYDKGTFTPLSDGEGKVLVKHNNETVELPLKVKDAKNDRPISFKLDVMPVFLNSGCNVGGCHGAARGKDGFELSLFGYDPNKDYHRITREFPNRRINLALPEDSLMLTKSTGKVAHTGGTRFKEDSENYKTLLRWIEAGAPQDDDKTVATPLSIDVYPPQMVLEGEGAKQQLTVRAKYSDGTDRDVTHLAVFLSNNDNSAVVNESGLITAKNRGEAFVMARFHTYTIGVQTIVIPKNLKYNFPSVPENSYIDTLVNAKLKKLRIVPSELCTDEQFIRRASLDIVGNLPTPEQLAAFVADKDPKKREKLVDELLTRKEFVEMWVMKWAE